jgi:hypothetical protein
LITKSAGGVGVELISDVTGVWLCVTDTSRNNED